MWPGLSPRVRGSPSTLDVAGVIAEVYPREYGAAACLCALIGGRRSIPASTGQPPPAA